MDSGVLAQRQSEYKSGVDNLKDLLSQDESLNYDKWSVTAQEAITKKAEDAAANFERMMLVDNASVQTGIMAFHQAGGIKGIVNAYKQTKDNTDVFKQYYNDKTQNLSDKASGIKDNINQGLEDVKQSVKQSVSDGLGRIMPQKETEAGFEMKEMNPAEEEKSSATLDNIDSYKQQADVANNELKTSEIEQNVGRSAESTLEGESAAEGIGSEIATAEADAVGVSEAFGEAAPLIAGAVAVGAGLFGVIQGAFHHHPHRQALQQSPNNPLPANYNEMKSYMVNPSSDAAIDAQASSVAF